MTDITPRTLRDVATYISFCGDPDVVQAIRDEADRLEEYELFERVARDVALSLGVDWDEVGTAHRMHLTAVVCKGLKEGRK